MLKLVALCVFVVAAVAEPKPDVLLAGGLVQPYGAVSTLVSPASTSISSQFSSVIHPSPITYSTPLGFTHFIKKRSPQFLTPAFNTYYPYNTASLPIVSASPLVQTPLTYSNVQVPLTTHLIKKRSAQLLPTSYITPTTYLSNPIYSSPLTSYIQNPYYFDTKVPIVDAHLIKKRSAALLPTTYISPSFVNTAPVYPYNPLINTLLPHTTIPLATTHLIKKRSADPQLISTIPSLPISYYSGSPFVSTYNPALTVVKTSPILTTDPLVYSTFIKK